MKMNVLMKISGEFFTAKDDLTPQGVKFLNELKDHEINSGYIVVGGGNRLRGKESSYERNASDNIGVLSTLMNGFVLKECFKKIGFESEVFSHFSNMGIFYSANKAKQTFQKGKWVILTTGLGHVGYVSTDLSSVIKSLELSVDGLVKVTKVNGIYNKDPLKEDSKLISKISYNEVFEKKIKVMDLSAMAIAWENELSIGICGVDNFADFIVGKNVGTIVGKEFRKNCL